MFLADGKNGSNIYILIELRTNRIEQKYIICDTDLVNNDFLRF